MFHCVVTNSKSTIIFNPVCGDHFKMKIEGKKKMQENITHLFRSSLLLRKVFFCTVNFSDPRLSHFKIIAHTEIIGELFFSDDLYKLFFNLAENKNDEVFYSLQQFHEDATDTGF